MDPNRLRIIPFTPEIPPLPRPTPAVPRRSAAGSDGALASVASGDAARALERRSHLPVSASASGNSPAQAASPRVRRKSPLLSGVSSFYRYQKEKKNTKPGIIQTYVVFFSILNGLGKAGSLSIKSLQSDLVSVGVKSLIHFRSGAI